jgi:translocation and assembly module TamB
MKEHTTDSHSNQKAGRKKPWFLIFFLLWIVTLTVGSLWLTTSSAGLRFLLSTASRLSGESVQFEQVEGTLRSLSIQKMRYISDDLHLTIETLELHWQPRLLFSSQLVINTLSIGTIELHSAPSTEPTVLPDSMRLPLSISLQELTIGALHTYTLGQESPDLTITHLASRLESDEHQHHLKEIALELAFGKLTGSARLGPDHPFDLNVQATLDNQQQIANTDTPEVAVAINLTGNLEEITGKITGMSAGAQGNGTFVMRPFAVMPLAALHLSIAELNPHAFLADMPEANLSIHTDLNEDLGGKLQGNLVIKNGLAQSLDQNGLPFIEIRAQPSISPDEIQFDDMLVKLADQASITGHFIWQIMQATGYADLKVNQLNPAALDTRLQAAKINGYLKLTGDTETQQGTISLSDKALSLEANVTRTETAINLEKLTLRHQASTLTGQGQFELKASQSFYFEGMLSQFDVASFVQAPRSNLNATLKLSGKLDPQVSGLLNFNIAKSHFAQQPVIGKGQLAFDDPQRIKSEIDLQIGNNRLSTKGAFGAKGDRLALNITAPALAQLALGLEGDLNAQLTLADTFDSPRLLIESNAQRLAVGGSHQLSDLTIAGDLHPTAVTLAINVANYRSDADDYLRNLAITLAGNQTRHTLSIETGLPQDSHFAFQTTGKLALSMENPQKFQWRGNIENLSATGFLPLHLLNQPTLSISQNSIALEPAKIAIAEGEINLLDTTWTPQQWSSRGTLTRITIPSENIPSQNIEALQMGGEWQITAGRQLSGHLRIARERGDWAFLLDDSPLKLGLQQLQFDARAQDNSLTADLVIRGERIGETIASGVLPLVAKDGNWQIAQDRPLNGTMNVKITDLAWVGPVVDSNLKSNGQLFLQARAHGTLNQPELDGTIEGEELGIALLDEGIHLQNGRFSAQFNQASLQINAFTFDAPHESPPRDRLLTKIKLAKNSGKLNVTGAIDYQDRRSHLNIEIDHLPLSQQSNRWIIASGDGQISLNDQQLTINGNIVADAGFILQPEAGRPQLADDIVIIGQTPPPEDAQKLLVSVDAALDLGNHFYLRASGLEGRLAGQLRLNSKPGQALYAIGTIATRDTRFSAYGQNLNVERGIVSFDGPLDDPGLNVLAIRKNLPVEAGVEVTGSVRNPIIRLVSTPNVPDSEKLSWIVLGRAPDASGVDTSLLLTAASSILGGQSGGGVMDQIGEALGVDEFSIRQQGTGDPLTSQIGTVGKRLSSRAYLSYERGLTTAAAGITKLTYSLTRNISIVTRAGDDNAIDVFYTFQLD